MRIRIFSYVFWPETFLINELGEELNLRGHQVSVLTSLPNYSGGRLQDGYSILKGPYEECFKGVTVYRYPVIARGQGFLRLSLNYLTNILAACGRVLLLPKSDVSFIFATSPIFTVLAAMLLKAVRGTPIVMWYQDLWPETFLAVAGVSEKSFFAKILEKFVKWVYQSIDVMMLQSPAFEENLKKYNYSGKVVHVPNWAPELVVDGAAPEWLESLPKDGFLICFAGNLGKAQALNALLDAAAQVKDPKVSFVVVGDGREAEGLRGRCHKENIKNVIFTGRKPLQDMPHLFSRCDLLLVSLAKDPLFSLTIPSKMQAYMASGKPILAFLDGVGAHIVETARCGFSAPAEDSRALIDAIERARAMAPEEFGKMGQRAREFYLQNYEKNRVISLIEDSLKEVTQ